MNVARQHSRKEGRRGSRIHHRPRMISSHPTEEGQRLVNNEQEALAWFNAAKLLDDHSPQPSLRSHCSLWYTKPTMSPPEWYRPFCSSINNITYIKRENGAKSIPISKKCRICKEEKLFSEFYFSNLVINVLLPVRPARKREKQNVMMSMDILISV